MLRCMTHGLLLSALLAPPVSANVVTDWDEIATRTLQTSYGTTVVASLPGLQNGRAMTLMHLAMFNAANCITPKYQSYGMQPEALPDGSQEAAVASAAGNVLIKLVPKDKTLSAHLQDYLAKNYRWSVQGSQHQAR